MLKLHTQLHTIYVLVGPSNCGKTTFANNLKDKLTETLKNNLIKPNIHILSSDEIRRNLLGDNIELNKSSGRMLEMSNPAFDLLFSKLKILTTFPVNAHFIILDTTGLGSEFRTKVLEIAKSSKYHCDIVIFNYDKIDDYHKFGGDHNLIKQQIKKLREFTLKEIRDQYTNKTFVRKRSTEIELTIDYIESYTKKILPNDKKYLIIGDIHESMNKLLDLLTKCGFVIIDNIIHRTNQTINTDIVFVGDIIDKGKKTIETIEFFHANMTTKLDNVPKLYCCIGNHELMLYNLLTGKKSPDDLPVNFLTNYFQSYVRIVDNKDICDKFLQIYVLMQNFFLYESVDHSRSFYVTHTPCNSVYLGKFDSESVQNQRYISCPKDMAVSSFILSYQQPDTASHPLHISGHFAFVDYVDGTENKHNYILIDTGAIYGNKLSAVLVGRSIKKPIFTSVGGQSEVDLSKIPALNTFDIINRSIPTDMPLDITPRMKMLANNKINYLSGTISPADKNLETNCLESLEEGINYYYKKYLTIGYPKKIVLQPKYMGSRCNVYLDTVNLSASYMISRNGYVIKSLSADITMKLYNDLFDRLRTFITNNSIKMLIIDCELMPWSAIGQGLIDESFKTVGIAASSESDILANSGFDEMYTKLITNSDYQMFKTDVKTMSKQELIKKYQNKYETFKNLFTESKTHITSTDYIASSIIYNNQLNTYANNTSEISIKPFNVLKIITTDNSEIIPDISDNGDFDTEKIFKLLSEDNICVIDLSIDQADIISMAKLFFETETKNNLMEGIVIKPLKPTDYFAPSIKVRNPEYLSIIYGMDYRQKYKYDKLIENKNIKKKLQLSITDYKIGIDLLKIPYTEISTSNQSYINLLKQFINGETIAESIDPRL